MQYRYTPDRDWSDFASGHVLRGQPGRPAFPVRLALEIFRQCIERTCLKHPLTVYDPCCGGGYLLTVLGLLNWPAIGHLIASDTDQNALQLARNNLRLLTVEGMESRKEQIESDWNTFGKESHRQALASAIRLKDLVQENQQMHPVTVTTFHADITDLNPNSFENLPRPDVVFTDIPHGRETSWILSAGTAPDRPAFAMLESLRMLGQPIVAIAAGKETRIDHPHYRRLKRFSAGKRQVVLVQSDLHG